MNEETSKNKSCDLCCNYHTYRPLTHTCKNCHKSYCTICAVNRRAITKDGCFKCVIDAEK